MGPDGAGEKTWAAKYRQHASGGRLRILLWALENPLEALHHMEGSRGQARCGYPVQEFPYDFEKKKLQVVTRSGTSTRAVSRRSLQRGPNALGSGSASMSRSYLLGLKKLPRPEVQGRAHLHGTREEGWHR